MKAQGISVKENFKTIKAEVSQVRMREALMISVNGVTFVPPECNIEDKIDAWGKWMSEQFDSGTISQSPSGPGFEIEDFTHTHTHTHTHTGTHACSVWAAPRTPEYAEGAKDAEAVEAAEDA